MLTVLNHPLIKHKLAIMRDKKATTKEFAEELDEIAKQADTAFYDLMDIAVNSSGKACGDIAASAQQFLNIKLQTRLSKTELKLKRMKQELDEKKYSSSLDKNNTSDDEFDDGDDIVIIDEQSK